MTRQAGEHDGSHDRAESHLRDLLATIAATVGADMAFFLVPAVDGDVLVRSSAGMRRTIPPPCDDGALASSWDGDGAGRSRTRRAISDARSLHPVLAAAVGAGAPVSHLLTLSVLDADGNHVGLLQLARTGTDAFPRSAGRSARRLAPCLASALACVDEVEVARNAVARHGDMLRFLSEGVIVIDALGIVASCNDAACAMLRLARTAAVGRSVAQVAGDMNGWLLEAIDRVAGERRELRLDDVEVFLEHDERWAAFNIALLPLAGGRGDFDGLMLLLRSLEREKALRRTVSRYVSPKMIDRVLDGTDARLAGRQQTATVLFSDIRGFTGLSERIGAAETVQLLNEYFSFMEDVVTNHGGTIDKYIGDAVMAVFGPPEPGGQDANNAAAAAVDMVRVLGLLNTQRGAETKPPIRIGIGLATGPVIAGSIGSANRMDFTVIGDAVNLASRIEGLTKTYGADVLVDGATAARLGDQQSMRRIDRVRVLGQTHPTDIHQIAALPPDDGALWRRDHEAALDLYFAGNWAAAHDAFQAVLARKPLDGAARLMAMRCAEHRARPPRGWDGITDLDRK